MLASQEMPRICLRSIRVRSHLSEINIAEYSPHVHFHSVQTKGWVKHSLPVTKQLYIITSCRVQFGGTGEVAASTNSISVWKRHWLLPYPTSHYCMILAIKNTNTIQNIRKWKMYQYNYISWHLLASSLTLTRKLTFLVCHIWHYPHFTLQGPCCHLVIHNQSRTHRWHSLGFNFLPKSTLTCRLQGIEPMTDC